MQKTTALVATAEKASLVHARRGREIVAAIREKKLTAAKTFYEIGSALLELEQKRLWAPLGYDTLMQLVAGEALMSPSQAKKLMEVTRRYTKESAAALGPDLAYAVARHVARTKTKDDVEDIVRLGFPLGGRRIPIEEVSVREVLRATQTAVVRQKGRHGDSARAKRDAETTAAEVARKLAKRGLEEPDVRLEFTGGQWVLAVRVPAARAEILLGARAA